MAELKHIYTDTSGTTTTSFSTTFGCLPRVSRSITREISPESGELVREIHELTVEGTMIASGADTDARQANLTSKIAAMEALEDDAEWRFEENDAGQAWSYDGTSGTTNNHATIAGMKIVRVDIPWGPAQHVTNVPYTITVQGEVHPCNETFAGGIATHSYTVTETYDASGLITAVSVSGAYCVCDGYDARDLLDDLIANLHGPDAHDRFWPTIVLQPPYKPTSITYQATRIDSTGTDLCATYQIAWSIPDGAESGDGNRVNAVVTINPENHIVAQITIRYPFIGSGTRAQAWQDAQNFEWPQNEKLGSYLPNGAGSIVRETAPQYQFSATEIVATRTFHLNWRFTQDIIEYDATVQVSQTHPGFSAHRLCHTRGSAGSATPPFAYCQESGHSAWRVTHTVRILSRDKYLTPEPLLTPDRANIWLIEPGSANAQHKRMRATSKNALGIGAQYGSGGISSSSSVDWYETRYTETYGVRDPSAAGLDQLPMYSIKDVGVIGSSPSLGGFS